MEGRKKNKVKKIGYLLMLAILAKTLISLATMKVPGGKVDKDCFQEMISYGDGSLEDWQAAVLT